MFFLRIISLAAIILCSFVANTAAQVSAHHVQPGNVYIGAATHYEPQHVCRDFVFSYVNIDQNFHHSLETVADLAIGTTPSSLFLTLMLMDGSPLRLFRATPPHTLVKLRTLIIS